MGPTPLAFWLVGCRNTSGCSYTLPTIVHFAGMRLEPLFGCWWFRQLVRSLAIGITGWLARCCLLMFKGGAPHLSALVPLVDMLGS